MRLICLHLLLSLWACHPQPAADVDADFPSIVLADCLGSPIIQDHLSGGPYESINGVRTPLPDSYKDAERRFAKAVTEFAEHRFVDAAREFLVVAQRIDDAAREFLVVERLPKFASGNAESFRSDRIRAYENAAIAYENAKAFDEGRREFTQRVHQDPACAAELQRIVRELNDREMNCKPVR